MNARPNTWMGLGLGILVALCCTGAAPRGGWKSADEARAVKLGEPSEDAAVVFSSMRWREGEGIAPWELYTSNREGNNVRRITFSERGHGYLHAAFSRDHRYLAAISGEVEPEHFWLFDLKEGTERELVADFAVAGVGGMDWSPEGFIYFTGGRKRGELDVYKIRPDGTELARLTETPEAETDVSIAADGSLVAYARMAVREGKIKPQIWVMRPDGSAQRMVYDGGPELGVHGKIPIGAVDPELSPDNRRVVFARTRTGHDNFGWGAYDICVIGLDGTGLEVLTPGTTSINAVPDWDERGLLWSEVDEKGGYVGLVTMRSPEDRPRRLEADLEHLWDGGRHAKWIPRREGGSMPTAASPPTPAQGGNGLFLSTGERQVSPGIRYENARFGTGFVSDAQGEIITYPTAGNMRLEEGTIELWIQIKDSIDDGLEWNPLFVAQQEPYFPIRAFIVQLIKHSTVVAYVAGTLKDNGVAAPIDWKKGESHYLAVTWSDSGLTLYLDGEQRSGNPEGPGLDRLPERMSAGGYIWKQAGHPSNTILDELRISSVAKSGAAIRSEFLRNAPFEKESDTLLLDRFDAQPPR